MTIKCNKEIAMGPMIVLPALCMASPKSEMFLLFSSSEHYLEARSLMAPFTELIEAKPAIYRINCSNPVTA
jgi:hypothetical protein